MRQNRKIIAHALESEIGTIFAEIGAIFHTDDKKAKFVIVHSFKAVQHRFNPVQHRFNPVRIALSRSPRIRRDMG
jgi:hypothetical protein